MIEDKREIDSHLAILEEELRMIRERDYYIGKLKKTQPSRSSRSSDSHF